MPIDDWLIFAYVMIFTSVVFCGILPMIFRLINARRRFHRYYLERFAMEHSIDRMLIPNETELIDDVS